MEISVAHFVMMAATIAAVIAGGLYAARSVHSAEGFSLGGRSAGVPLVAGSIAGTCVGGGATVGTAQLAATVGLSAWWFTIGTGLALIVMGFFYARPLRVAGLTTISEYLVLNYGRSAGHFTSVVSSLGILFSAVASILPGLGLIENLLGVSTLGAAALLLALVSCYAFFGGMRTAGVGGMLKMAVLWTSLMLAGGIAMQAVAEPAVAAAIPASWHSLLGQGTHAALNNVASLMVGMLCTQSYIQAIFSAATPRTAAVGAFTAALVTIPIGLPCAMIGMYMHATHPEVSPLLVLPTYLLTYQSPLVGGIAMGGIVLALISSIAGLSLGIGTMLSRDIFERLLGVTTGAARLRLNRIVVVAVIAAATAIAIVNEGSQILFWNYLSMALRGGGIFLPLTIAIFRPHAIAPAWAVASMVLSTVTALVAGAVGTSVSPLFIGLGVSLALIIVGKLCARNK